MFGGMWSCPLSAYGFDMMALPCLVIEVDPKNWTGV